MPIAIRQIAYELYKQYWIDTHTSPEERMKALVDYYSWRVKNKEDVSFSDWIWFESSNGFNGSSYACFAEFLNKEYREQEFVICELFKGERELTTEYLKGIN